MWTDLTPGSKYYIEVTFKSKFTAEAPAKVRLLNHEETLKPLAPLVDFRNGCLPLSLDKDLPTDNSVSLNVSVGDQTIMTVSF